MRLPPAVRFFWPAILLLGGLAILAADAEDEETTIPLRVPHVAGPVPVLDGRLDDAAWADAVALPSGSVDVPVPAPDPQADRPGSVRLEPDVRLLVAAGRLWIGIDAAEAPGAGMGFACLLGFEPLPTAADAVAIGYGPQDPRGPRYQAYGPRGVGRGIYRVRGAADVGRRTAWSVEVCVPLADLAPPTSDVRLRLALAVRTRTPSLVAWAPEGAAFEGPDSWMVLTPPEGGWPVEASDLPEAEALVAEDAEDSERVGQWQGFLAADAVGLDRIVAAVHPDLDPRHATREQLLDAFERVLLAPLTRISEMRPDLAWAWQARADVLRRLGLFEEARRAYATALEVLPGFREARAGLALGLDGPAMAEGMPGAPTPSYDDALARAEAAGEAAGEDAVARDGALLGQALLWEKRGEFERARALLDPLAGRHPSNQLIVYASERVHRALERWPRERVYRTQEAEVDDLPRVVVETSRGPLTLELFENDAPNTVKHFVWLVANGHYDGRVVDRSQPFLGVQVGDANPLTDPGYAIPTEERIRSSRPGSRSARQEREARRRLPFRGALVLVSPTPNAGGTHVLLTTGSALHLDEGFTVFGRVLAGQEVVEGLVPGDRIEKARVLRTRPGTEYRPMTVEGLPAPLPRR